MMLSVVISSILLQIFLNICDGQITSHLDQSEIAAFRSTAENTLLHPKSLQDAYFATRLLKTLDVSAISCDCEDLLSLLSKQSEHFQIFYGTAAYTSCVCGDFAPSEMVKKAVEAGMKADDLNTLAGAVMAGHALGYSVDLDPVLEKVKSLLQPDGLFRTLVSKKKSASLQNTITAIDLLALFPNESFRAEYKEIAETVIQLLPTGDDEIAVDPTILSSLSKISSKKPRLVGSRLLAVVESLLSLRYSSDITSIAKVLESLNFATTYKIQPLHVIPSKSSFSVDEIKKFTVSIVDVLGQTVTSEAIVVDVSKKYGRDARIFQTNSTDAVIDLSNAGMELGMYNLELAISVPGRPKQLVVQLPIAVLGKVEVLNVYVGVTDSLKVDKADLERIKHQNDLSGMHAAAADSEVVHVQFSISAPKAGRKRVHKPHQAFVKFTHIESGLSTFMVASHMGDGLYKVGTSLTAEMETFLYKSGDYTIAILVADVLYAAPVEWLLGTVVLKFPVKAVKESPLYSKSLLHESDNTLTALPEIEHKMRPPAQRASDFMATLFTALSLLPLVGFIVFVFSQKPIIRLASIGDAAFVAAIAAMLLLYVGYWLAIPGISFYETIKYIIILAPITWIVGRSALAKEAPKSG